MSDLTLLSVEFNEYNTAFGSTQSRILNNTIDKLTISDKAFNSATNSAVNSIVQELYESRSGRPGLSVLTSLLVSVDVKLY